MHHNIVQGVLQQADKKYLGDRSHMTQGEPINVHVAEIFQQAEGAGIYEGGWVGGDAFFGSVTSCIE